MTTCGFRGLTTLKTYPEYYLSMQLILLNFAELIKVINYSWLRAQCTKKINKNQPDLVHTHPYMHTHTMNVYADVYKQIIHADVHSSLKTLHISISTTKFRKEVLYSRGQGPEF